MKKYVYLFLATILLVSVILMSGNIIVNDALETELFTLRAESVDNTVTASGKLQYTSKYEVKPGGIGVVKSIDVKQKDKVKKGDLLFTYYELNQEAEQMILQYGDIQSVLSMLSDSSLKKQMLEEVKKNSRVKKTYAEKEGTVREIKYSQNDVIDQSSVIMKISDENALEIPININESYVEQIEKNQKAEIVFTAFPNEKYTGTVTEIADEATQTSGLSGKEVTVAVVIKPDDKLDEKVRVGYSADCSVITSTDNNILIIPYEYIRSDDDGDYVYLYKNRKAKKVYIKTGKEYKSGAEVISGINQNDQIIKKCDNVYDGQKIKVIGE